MDRDAVEKIMKTVYEPQLIETHISFVILSGNFAYKIKKSVKFSFLDFSDLEKRKFFCHEEVRLNNRLTSGIYLEVVEILVDKIFPANESYFFKPNYETKLIKNGSLDGKIYEPIEERNQIEEYAVKMRRLDQEKKMDNLLKKNKISELHIKKLARKIAQFHKKIKIEKEKYSSPDILRDQIMDLRNFAQIVDEAAGLKKEIEKVLKKSDEFISKKRKLLEERMKKGFVRECHGDLHSGNVFIEDDIYPIDCIEFSKDFRIIDVVSEIAFMAMDLDSFGRKDFSDLFVKEYLTNFEDKDFMKLLNFYKCYKANIRAKIAAIEWSHTKNDDAKKRIEKYITLAAGYANRF